jgi:hypothetical protein
VAFCEAERVGSAESHLAGRRARTADGAAAPAETSPVGSEPYGRLPFVPGPSWRRSRKPEAQLALKHEGKRQRSRRV